MIDKTEAERIAEAVHALRPEWPAQSILTLIGNSPELRSRAYRDLAVALTYVACDASSLTPGRVKEAGPWWANTNAQRATVSTITTRCGEHPSHPALHCPICEAEAAEAPSEAYLAAKAALKLRDRPTAAHPEPPTTNLAATRERADAQEA